MLFGVVLAVVGALAFGINVVLFKVAFRAGATPVSLLSMRFSIAAAFLLGFHALTHDMKISSRMLVQLVLMGIFGALTGPLLYAYAVNFAPVSVVSPLFFTYPLWAGLIAIVSRLTPLRSELLLALGLGFAGVVLLFSLPRGFFVGSLFALAAGFATALYFLWAQVLIRSVRPATGAVFATASGAILFLSVTAATREWIPVDALLPTAAIGFLTAIGYLATFEAIGRIGAVRSAIVQLLEPVTSILLAVAFLAEALTIRMVIGTCLVLSTLPLIARAKVPVANAPPG